MSRAFHRVAVLAWGVLCGCVASAAMAQGAQVYRYVDTDGRIVYSDRAPPPSAKDVQLKKLGPNVVESQVPVNTQMAQERYPVTLYTFACGEYCRNAETLLNRRGVPFKTINVSSPDGAEKLLRLTGEQQAPVLQGGDKLIAKGYNESVWQGLLTEAGYPKTPPPRRAQPVRSEAAAPKTEPAKGAAPVPPPPGAGYPVH